METDFNLNNYDLPELLNLFQLNPDFNLDDLKRAKKIVLQIHPDKSGLDKEYFLFYCKAFRIIKNIYDFKHKKQVILNADKSKITYLADDDNTSDKKILINNLLKKDSKNFNEWFNKTFEQFNILNEENQTGYGSWLSSIEDIDNTVTNLSDMHQKILEKKETLSALVTKDMIKDTTNSVQQYCNLEGSVPESYSSSIFSKLGFEDLKKAHTETVVPVSQHDYNSVLKFKNEDVLRQFRNSQNIKPISQKEADKYFNNKTIEEEHEHTYLAFKLAKQEEIAEVTNKKWWANLRLLK